MRVGQSGGDTWASPTTPASEIPRPQDPPRANWFRRQWSAVWLGGANWGHWYIDEIQDELRGWEAVGELGARALDYGKDLLVWGIEWLFYSPEEGPIIPPPSTAVDPIYVATSEEVMLGLNRGVRAAMFGERTNLCQGETQLYRAVMARVEGGVVQLEDKLAPGVLDAVVAGLVPSLVRVTATMDQAWLNETRVRLLARATGLLPFAALRHANSLSKDQRWAYLQPRLKGLHGAIAPTPDLASQHDVELRYFTDQIARVLFLGAYGERGIAHRVRGGWCELLGMRVVASQLAKVYIEVLDKGLSPRQMYELSQKIEGGGDTAREGEGLSDDERLFFGELIAPSIARDVLGVGLLLRWKAHGIIVEKVSGVYLDFFEGVNRPLRAEKLAEMLQRKPLAEEEVKYSDVVRSLRASRKVVLNEWFSMAHVIERFGRLREGIATFVEWLDAYPAAIRMIPNALFDSLLQDLFPELPMMIAIDRAEAGAVSQLPAILRDRRVQEALHFSQEEACGMIQRLPAEYKGSIENLVEKLR